MVALAFTADPIVRYFQEHRYFALREVGVEGTERLTSARVRLWLGMVEGQSIWQESTWDLEENLRRHPEVADATVTRVLPNRLEVVVLERDPEVVVRDRSGFFLADDKGVLFEETLPDAQELRELPIVTIARGGDVADAPDASHHEVDVALGDVNDLAPHILEETIALAGRLGQGHGGISVSEVTLEEEIDRIPQVVVFSTDGELAVRLGWGDWDEKLSSLARVVAHAKRSGHGSLQGLSGRLDVRDPQAVVARWARDGEA